MLWKIEKAIAAPFHIALTLALAPFKVAVYHLGTFVGVFVAGVKREAGTVEADAKSSIKNVSINVKGAEAKL